jgi:hypothetical protein
VEEPSCGPGAPELVLGSPFQEARARRISLGPRRAFTRKEDPRMELAAVILFSAVVLWIVEEAADEHV